MEKDYCVESWRHGWNFFNTLKVVLIGLQHERQVFWFSILLNLLEPKVHILFPPSNFTLSSHSCYCSLSCYTWCYFVHLTLSYNINQILLWKQQKSENMHNQVCKIRMLCCKVTMCLFWSKLSMILKIKVTYKSTMFFFYDIRQ